MCLHNCANSLASGATGYEVPVQINHISRDTIAIRLVPRRVAAYRFAEREASEVGIDTI